MNTLFIDTSNNKEISVGLEIDDKKDFLVRIVDAWKAQIVLPMIYEILEKNKITMKDINSIRVNLGPGSFTGLRVGVTIANTLGTWLKIPINEKPIGEIVEPRYQ